MKEEIVIGARALGEQIYKIMPTYSILLQQLEEIRNVANAINSQKRDKEVSKRDVNNTIGIFGERGTGKTSVLYTVQQHIHNNNNDIILPLIEPDNFGDNTKIIGSIVGFLKEEGDKILKKLEMLSHNKQLCEEFSKYFNKGTLKPNNPLKQIINETIEYHLYTENQYRNLLGQNYEDLATHIKKSSRLLVPDIAFKKKLNELIDEIVYIKQKLNESHVPSLIFIFIDDIDLKTSKTRELMDALLQYTNHPHIVTVLSGDYEILLESLTIALLEDESLNEIGLNPYSSLKRLDKPNPNFDSSSNNDEFSKFTIMRRKSNLAHEYLKKVIPSARRHQLIKWSEETIPYFAFGEATLLSQLAKLMGDHSIFSYKKEPEINNSNNLSPIKGSFKIFDERPRGIVYAYYNLVELLNFKEKWEQEDFEDLQEFKKDWFRYVKTFIDTLIVSSSHLLLYQELFFGRFILWGNDASSTFINYSRQLLQEDDLDIQLLAIGEIVQELLSDVKYNKSNYKKFQEKIFTKLIWRPRGAQSSPPEFNNIHYNTYPLYHLIRGLVLGMDVKSSMLLLEYLSLGPLVYYQHSWLDKEKSVKDRFILLQIAKLIDQYPSIFEQLYYQSHVDKQEEVSYALNSLHDLCKATPEYERSERILRGFIFEKKKELPGTMILKYELLVNNLTAIRTKNLNEFNRNFLESIHFSKLTNSLERIIEQSDRKIGKLPKSVQQTIESNMYVFGKYLYSKLSRENIAVYIEYNEHGKLNDAVEHFLNNYSGEGNTYYKKLQSEIGSLIDENYLFKYRNTVKFEVYEELISKLKQLSLNNRVWYGQKEARDFLNMLKQFSSIHGELNDGSFIFIDDEDINVEEHYTFLDDEDRLVLKLYSEYFNCIQSFKEDEQYEDAKIKIRQKLDQAYEKVRESTDLELSDFNFSLEDAESEIDFDE